MTLTIEEPASHPRPRILPARIEAQGPAQELILVVEDDLLARSVLEHMLGTRGYRVLGACDGDAAIRLVSSEHPDLVLLDVMMPGPDGFQVLRWMKSSPDFSNIPVVMLTARAKESDITSAFELGASDYMVKPFLTEELLVRIKRLLPGRRSSEDEGTGIDHVVSSGLAISCHDDPRHDFVPPVTLREFTHANLAQFWEDSQFEVTLTLTAPVESGAPS